MKMWLKKSLKNSNLEIFKKYIFVKGITDPSRVAALFEKLQFVKKNVGKKEKINKKQLN